MGRQSGVWDTVFTGGCPASVSECLFAWHLAPAYALSRPTRDSVPPPADAASLPSLHSLARPALPSLGHSGSHTQLSISLSRLLVCKGDPEAQMGSPLCVTFPPILTTLGGAVLLPSGRREEMECGAGTRARARARALGATPTSAPELHLWLCLPHSREV